MGMKHVLLHAALWEVIDRMADDVGSLGELTRKAGLAAPYHLSPSHRSCKASGPRWPNSRTIFALCQASGWTVERFGRECDALIAAGELPKRQPRKPGNPLWRKQAEAKRAATEVTT